jgi:hypothetical protein
MGYVARKLFFIRFKPFDGVMAIDCAQDIQQNCIQGANLRDMRLQTISPYLTTIRPPGIQTLPNTVSALGSIGIILPKALEIFLQNRFFLSNVLVEDFSTVLFLGFKICSTIWLWLAFLSSQKTL